MNGLNKLWIIHREAGVCVFEQSFEELPKNINSDMIGGFLIAILSFSQEMADQEIEFLQLKNLRIIYHITPQYIIAVGCNQNANYKELEKLLAQVETRFELKYHNVIGKGYSGNTTVFNDFATEVEKIFDSKSTALKYFEERLDDIKGYYEDKRSKLFDFYNKMFVEKQFITEYNGLIGKVISPLKKLGNLKKDVEKKIKNKIHGHADTEEEA